MAEKAKKALPAGQRWVTVKKEGPLHGRRLLIDGKGHIVGGKVPSTFHGHHIGRLAGLDPSDTSYHSFSHDELKEIHGEFKQHHDDLKKQLAEDIHGHAKGLRDAHVASNKEDDIISKIRAKGGIKIHEGHANHTEYKESVDPEVRKAVSSKNGMPLDEVADEMGMSARDLIEKLSNAQTSSYSKIEDFHDEAKKQMGDDYEQRLSGIKEMGKHVSAIEAAMKRHEHAKAQEKAQKEADKASKQKEKAQPKSAAWKKEGIDATHEYSSKDGRSWFGNLSKEAQEGVEKEIEKRRKADGANYKTHRVYLDDLYSEIKGEAEKHGQNDEMPDEEPKQAEKKKPDPHKFDGDKLKKITQFGGYRIEENSAGRHNLTVTGQFKGKDGEHDDEAQMGDYASPEQAERHALRLRQKLHGTSLPPRTTPRYEPKYADGDKEQPKEEQKEQPKADPADEAPKAPEKSKIAGDGMPFKKVQNVRNNKFLEHAEGAFGVHEQHLFKQTRKILHEKGYDAAIDYIDKMASGSGYNNKVKMTSGDGAGRSKMEHLRHLAEADKAKGNGLAPKDADEAPKNTDEAPQNQTGGKKMSDLHNDVQSYMDGKMDENEFFKKHLDKFKRSGEKVGANSKGDAEDVGGSALETAFKTLRALKNGTQKPKEGTDLGEHLMSRVKQGSKEAVRQGNENSLTREGAKLASIINQHRSQHINEHGSDPSEDQLFDRVKGDKSFQDTKFVAPGTKKSVDDHREKFNAVREAMKGQRSDAVLDKQVEGKDGSVGTVGGNMADPKGSAEDQVVDLENKREMNARRDQLHGAFKEMGLSDHEAHAVSNRFGVGHDTQGFQDWDTVAKHMSKALGKKVSPDSAKKHFQNGRAKLHQHIGDERMGLLMQKSLIVDPAVQNLIYHLHLCGIYDLLKSQGMENEEQLDSAWERTTFAMDRGELLKSLAPDEFIGEEATWADGSVTAQIHKFSVRG